MFILNLILFAHFPVCSINYSLKTFQSRNSQVGCGGVIAYIQLRNVAASFGFTCVVLHIKSPLPMRCYQCKTSTRQKWMQVRKIHGKLSICSQPPPYLLCVIAGHLLVLYSSSSCTVTDVHLLAEWCWLSHSACCIPASPNFFWHLCSATTPPNKQVT